MSARALKDRLRTDLKAAMREGRAGEVSTLRTLIAAIDNAEAVPTDHLAQRLRRREDLGEVARRALDRAALGDILAGEARSRLAAAEDYERGGRPEEAARLREETKLIERYRP